MKIKYERHLIKNNFFYSAIMTFVCAKRKFCFSEKKHSAVVFFYFCSFSSIKSTVVNKISFFISKFERVNDESAFIRR